MNRQIRVGAFETNSSSSHSLVISPGEITQNLLPKDVLRAGILYVGKGEYGWEWKRLYSLRNKLDYLVTQLTVTREYDSPLPRGEADEVTKEIRQEYPKVDQIFRMVEKHIGGGFEVLLVPGSRGHVDHQSALLEFTDLQEVLEDEDRLQQLLFNPESYIQTGNDNSSAGKLIETDRGLEDFYERFYAKVPELARQMTFKLERWWDQEIEIRKGVTISPVSHPELFEKIFADVVVTQVHLESRGRYNPYQDYSEPEEDRAWAMVAGKIGLKGVKNLKFSSEHIQSKGDDDRFGELVKLTVKVPAALADTLRQLKKSLVAEASA